MVIDDMLYAGCTIFKQLWIGSIALVASAELKGLFALGKPSNFG